MTGKAVLFGLLVLVILAAMFIYNGGFMHGDLIE